MYHLLHNLDELPPVDDIQFETHALPYAVSGPNPDYDNPGDFMIIESYHPSTPVRDRTKMFPKMSSTTLEKSWHGLVQIVIWIRA
jgi:hypothetical protein